MKGSRSSMTVSVRYVTYAEEQIASENSVGDFCDFKIA